MDWGRGGGRQGEKVLKALLPEFSSVPAEPGLGWAKGLD